VEPALYPGSTTIAIYFPIRPCSWSADVIQTFALLTSHRRLHSAKWQYYARFTRTKRRRGAPPSNRYVHGIDLGIFSTSFCLALSDIDGHGFAVAVPRKGSRGTMAMAPYKKTWTLPVPPENIYISFSKYLFLVSFVYTHYLYCDFGQLPHVSWLYVLYISSSYPCNLPKPNRRSISAHLQFADISSPES
jgi:hypothetical protein